MAKKKRRTVPRLVPEDLDSDIEDRDEALQPDLTEAERNRKVSGEARAARDRDNTYHGRKCKLAHLIDHLPQELWNAFMDDAVQPRVEAISARPVLASLLLGLLVRGLFTVHVADPLGLHDQPVYTDIPVFQAAIPDLSCRNLFLQLFYDRDASAALNIRRCAVGPGPRPTELCYWDGRCNSYAKLTARDAQKCRSALMLNVVASRAIQSVVPTSERFGAVLLDVTGTLLQPSEPVAEVYQRFTRPFLRPGQALFDQEEILQRFRWTYNHPERGCAGSSSSMRFVGDGRQFWSRLLTECTGCPEAAMHEAVYRYYAGPSAWRLVPGAVQALEEMRAAGVRLAVVSNWDTRLRPLMRALRLDHLFHALIVSAEVGCEKPNRCIFEAALTQLGGVEPGNAVHVGDDRSGHDPEALPCPAPDPSPLSPCSQGHAPEAPDLALRHHFTNSFMAQPPYPPLPCADLGPERRRDDVWGARDAGLHAWLWGEEVCSFAQLSHRVLHGRRDTIWDREDEAAAEESAAGGLATPPQLPPSSPIALSPCSLPAARMAPTLMNRQQWVGGRPFTAWAATGMRPGKQLGWA
ncbi:hypothetical protein QJQ45_011466 [Haematococcus lacustris]|nr:hypothetical protein QJQ45_011466 [Haematococcus lacustris]